MNNWKEFIKLYKDNENIASTFFHRHFSKNLAKILVYLSLKIGLSPNTVSFLSSATLLIGSILSLKSQNILYLLIFSQLSYALDCSDGVIARITMKSSIKGKFIDLILDRINQLIFAWSIILFSIKIKETELNLILVQGLMFSLYFIYSSIAMIRGLVMNTKRGEGLKKVNNLLYKIPYEFIDSGIFMFIITIASIFNIDYTITYLYLILNLAMSIGIVAITLKDQS